jgi:thioredoxin-related protein
MNSIAKEKGIEFENELNWKEIQAKAKAEKKFIFLYCYATWCGRCKQMDRNIFVSEEVGAIFKNFISVKIQMDSTSLDNKHVRMWYADSRRFQQQYGINAFPTFLFFSPEGKLVHRGIGYLEINDFVQLAIDARSYNAQYYTLLQDYQEGRKNYNTLPKLIRMTREFGELKLAEMIAKDYKLNFFDKLDKERMCTKDNLDFISEYLKFLSSKDSLFRLCYIYPTRIDSIRKFNGWATYVVKQIINREEIENKVWKGESKSIPITNNPNWKRIYKSIKDKYGEIFAGSLVSSGQLAFYRKIGNWSQYANLIDILIRENPPKVGEENLGYIIGGLAKENAWALNGIAWDAFENCTDKKVLLKAFCWSELSIRLDSLKSPDGNFQFLDTKANLLYKLGNVHDAIEFEMKAISADLINAKKEGLNKGAFTDEFEVTIDKMKLGSPTWPIKKE